MRRWLIVAAACLLTLIAADTMLWYWAVGQVSAQTALWAKSRRAEGWTVEMGPQAREGWPLAARIRVQTVVLAATAPTTVVPVTLDLSEAVIGVSFVRPQHLVIGLEGTHRLRMAAAPPLAFVADRLELVVPLLTDRDTEEADLTTTMLRLSAPAEAAGLTVGEAAVHLAFPQRQPVSATLLATRIDLPPTAPLTAIGPRVDTLSLDATISGERLEIQNFALAWGSLSLSSHASLGLDARRQPAGTGSATLEGMTETLDALVAAKLVAPRPASAAKAVLALLQRPQPTGRPVVQLPLSLQDRTLQFGGFPVARLPEMTW